jgi:hypothetical protein
LEVHSGKEGSKKMSDGSVDIEVGLTKDQFNKRIKIRKK